MKCKRLFDGRSYGHANLGTIRQRAVQAIDEGQTAANVASIFGVNIRSVFRWLERRGNGGEESLKAKPIPGAPTKLNYEQMSWIAHVVHKNTPQDFDFESGLWSLKIIRHLVKRKFGIEISTGTSHNLMKRLGFSAQKPLYQAWQQDPEQVRVWEEKTFPAIVEQARIDKATVYFADESGIRSDYHTGTTWALVGETPVLAATGRRFSLNMISAISRRGDMRFMLSEKNINSSVFIDFLKRLMIGQENPVFLIVDGHPVHHSGAVKKYVEDTKGKLRLFYLPPYSPQLNPDESIWAHVKRDVAKKIVHDKDVESKNYLSL